MKTLHNKTFFAFILLVLTLDLSLLTFVTFASEEKEKEKVDRVKKIIDINQMISKFTKKNSCILLNKTEEESSIDTSDTSDTSDTFDISLNNKHKGIYSLLNQSSDELEKILSARLFECELLMKFKLKNKKNMNNLYEQCINSNNSEIKGVYSKENYLTKRAAYVIDRMLQFDLIPPIVIHRELINRKASSSLQMIINNTISAKDANLSHKISLPLLLLDYIIENCGRDQSNILFKKGHPNQEIAINNNKTTVFSHAYCALKFRKKYRGQMHLKLEKDLEKYGGVASYEVKNLVTNIINAFNSNSMNTTNKELCNELKNGLLGKEELLHLNRRFDHLQIMVFGKIVIKNYCTNIEKKK
ncbi:MAG: hypothetical protein HQK49_17695 [Oligoflexia bacterium]|nr:hypothetical protein [Oligoflexia bacterium]